MPVSFQYAIGRPCNPPGRMIHVSQGKIPVGVSKWTMEQNFQLICDGPFFGRSMLVRPTYHSGILPKTT